MHLLLIKCFTTYQKSETHQEGFMLQIRHNNNNMIIFPEAVFNSHNIILSPRRKAMLLNKDQKMDVSFPLFLKNFSQAFFYNPNLYLRAVLSAIGSCTLAAHQYVPFELHFMLHSAVWNENSTGYLCGCGL